MQTNNNVFVFNANHSEVNGLLENNLIKSNIQYVAVEKSCSFYVVAAKTKIQMNRFIYTFYSK